MINIGAIQQFKFVAALRDAKLGAALRARMQDAIRASRRGFAPQLRHHLKKFLDAARPMLFSSMKQPEDIPGEPKSEVQAFLTSCRRVFWGMATFSGLSNVLMLTSSFFLLQVYDRVLPSRSVPTLVALLLLVTALYVAQGALDLVRSRLSVRVGRHFDETLSLRVFDAVARLPLKTRGDGDGLQPLRDLDQIRAFLSGPGPSALFDLPWMPLYLGIAFLFHVWIGATALVGVVILVALTALTELRTKTPAKAFAGHAMSRNALAIEARRNAEVLHAMGMRGHAASRWNEANRKYLAAHEMASDVATGIGGISKAFRMFLQSTVLAVGAYLVIYQEATAGIIIASSILTSRALAPVDMVIANWKNLIAARQSAKRLNELLIILPADEERFELPAPKHSLAVDSLHVRAPGGERLVVNNVSFSLKGGQGLGIIGPSGSGKTSLARALVGVWAKQLGSVRLDNAPLEQWPSDALGRHVGYLPQDVELFEGSILANICRFYPNATAQGVLEAAHAAGVHDLILSFPQGYSTRIGEGGMTLSAGQRQRIGLARALYGNPFLVVLDEPSSNLDAEGEGALTRAIMDMRRQGRIAIVVAHRPQALDALDHVLAMSEGKALCFGPRDEVLKKILRTPTRLMPVDNKVAQR